MGVHFVIDHSLDIMGWGNCSCTVVMHSFFGHRSRQLLGLTRALVHECLHTVFAFQVEIPVTAASSTDNSRQLLILGIYCIRASRLVERPFDSPLGAYILDRL